MKIPSITKHWGKTSLILAPTAAALIWVAANQKGFSQNQEAENAIAAEQQRIETELSDIKKTSKLAGDSPENLTNRVDAWKKNNAERLAKLRDLTLQQDNANPNASGEGLVGFANAATGSSFAVGFNNQVVGTNSTAIGEGLVLRANNSAAVGTFNTTTGNSAGAVFAVGVGTAENRANALEVRPNGDVVLARPQGDIPMYNPEAAE